MASQRSKELTRPQLAIRAKKVLESLDNHWEGLTQFVHNPDIPMDNNIAEQTIRGGVLGRKNYYGSGSEWSSELVVGLICYIAWILTPNSILLISKPMTISCILSSFEKQIVFLANRLIQVRKFRFLRSIF